MAVYYAVKVYARPDLFTVISFLFYWNQRGGNARRTLTVLALGDRDPLGRYGLVRSGIIRNG